MSASGGRKRSGKAVKFSRHDTVRASVFEADILMQGYLEKLSSGMVKRWQSRYFELAGPILRYFEHAFPRTNDNIRGVIYLDALISCSTDGQNVIHLHFSDNQAMQLRARSRENADRWVAEIADTVHLTRSQGTADVGLSLIHI